MNRIDRVTSILIQLQSKKVVRAQEIADRFAISLRTVYRDIRTLEAAGIPITGEAGVGYSIMEGYRLPPVMFTREEAIAFLTAEKLLGKLTDPLSGKHFREAMYKVKAVLRYAEKALLDDMEKYIEVIRSPYLPASLHQQIHLPVFLDSIIKKEVLDIRYFANHSQQYSQRAVEPVGIFFMAGYWYLIAFCRLRQDYRHFRIDRISNIQSTGVLFEKQHPTLQSFITSISKENEVIEIVIRVEKSILKFLGDQKYYNGFVGQKEVGNKMEMNFLSGSLRGFAKFYLLFGEFAEIIRPAALKEVVQENMAAIAEKLALS